MQNRYINPKSINANIKLQLINDNMIKSSHENYKICPINQSVRFTYKKKYVPRNIDSICKVYVYQNNAVNIANKLCDHGADSLKTIDPNIPIIVQIINKSFNGRNFESTENVYDDHIMLKSNYSFVIKKQYELFENNNNISSIYSFPITFIRDDQYKLTQIQNLFKTGVITIIYEKQNDLIECDQNYCLTSNDFLHLRMYYDTIFQTAISTGHKIIILSVIDNSFDVPINDQIKIFNLCIMIYGHLFKSIIICIPPNESNDIYMHFDEYIIKPQELTKKIDTEYLTRKMEKQLEKSSK